MQSCLGCCLCSRLWSQAALHIPHVCTSTLRARARAARRGRRATTGRASSSRPALSHASRWCRRRMRPPNLSLTLTLTRAQVLRAEDAGREEGVLPRVRAGAQGDRGGREARGGQGRARGLRGHAGGLRRPEARHALLARVRAARRRPALAGARPRPRRAVQPFPRLPRKHALPSHARAALRADARRAASTACDAPGAVNVSALLGKAS